jgi:hypothetical protein
MLLKKNKKYCSNKKFKDVFVGLYERDKKGERVLVLESTNTKKPRRITFESHQACKAQGWDLQYIIG